MMKHDDEEAQQTENLGAFVCFISLNERIRKTTLVLQYL